ncbi:MAG: hypothetical protein K0R14_488 [Burkholderiales bacterium]|jgi:hypothetical protein|nr:hypothetical protein [Burkholderiales bacterium]
MKVNTEKLQVNSCLFSLMVLLSVTTVHAVNLECMDCTYLLKGIKKYFRSCVVKNSNDIPQGMLYTTLGEAPLVPNITYVPKKNSAGEIFYHFNMLKVDGWSITALPEAATNDAAKNLVGDIFLDIKEGDNQTSPVACFIHDLEVGNNKDYIIKTYLKSGLAGLNLNTGTNPNTTTSNLHLDVPDGKADYSITTPHTVTDTPPSAGNNPHDTRK